MGAAADLLCFVMKVHLLSACFFGDVDGYGFSFLSRCLFFIFAPCGRLQPRKPSSRNGNGVFGIQIIL